MGDGVDLIKEQIRIADGQKLGMKQKEVRISGHAIECRINAENPMKNFRPSPGTITDVHFPGGEGIRVDTAVYTGYQVPPCYFYACKADRSWRQQGRSNP